MRAVHFDHVEHARPISTHGPEYAASPSPGKRRTASLTHGIAANHRYSADESDWGFTRFAELRRMFAGRWDGTGKSMVDNDAVNLTAYLRIYKDPTGVLWHKFIKSVGPSDRMSVC